MKNEQDITQEEKKRVDERLEKMQQQLYGQNYSVDTQTRSTLSHTEVNVNNQWKPEPEAPRPKTVLQEKKPISLFNKIFIVSLVFFLVSAAIALIVFYWGFNVVSTDKVDVQFVGPASISAGDQIDFNIDIKNENTTGLVNVEMYVDFPEGTKEAQDQTKDLNHLKKTIGTIGQGSSVRTPMSAVFFGKTQTKRTVSITLHYSLASSNGSYTKEKKYDVVISSSPLAMNITYPPQTASGQNITFNVEVISNASIPQQNLLFAVDYPFGFEFQSADPKPVSDNNIWKIPLLKPGEKKTFTLTGRTEGEEGDDRTFKFNIGTADTFNEKKIATAYLTSVESLTVKRAPIAVYVTLNNSAAKEITAQPGSNINSKIQVINNMQTQLVDAKVDVILSGNAFDAGSPRISNSGLYRLPTRTISWDKTMVPELALVDPGDKVDLSFLFSSLPPDVLSRIRNGSINVNVSLTGTSLGSSEPLSSNFTRIIKIQPALGLNSRLVYSIGPFTNTGPMPPKSESVTTYTAIWTIYRSSNEVNSAEVRATLPSYVTWKGVFSPTSENVTWIPERNEVVWRVGDISGGIVGSVAKEVSFQIALTPSFSQRGTAPELVQNITLKAVDTFTNRALIIPGGVLTTSMSTDPRFQTAGLVQ